MEGVSPQIQALSRGLKAKQRYLQLQLVISKMVCLKRLRAGSERHLKVLVLH